ncbi:GLPGLI family protein [Marinigracilibium pacificum]|uniref:GLPGLI family protein n=1 Tax=Marinigracilibium pacificum TaxID=2729599 RepID=A0A848JCZ9_9BACT|nr:GLPGLI family protein [Marinigracilibium pacificum]NMM50872.1 GLPGLI family protein [Marinigracilibium pacificum]
MKNILKISILVLMIVYSSSSTIAQQVTGKAIYKSFFKVEINFDSTDTNPEVSAQIQKQLQQQMQRDYELVFNNTESHWKQLESLNNGMAQASSGGMVIELVGLSANEILYKNIGEGRFIEGKSMFEKDYKITDQLELINWKITSETKQIGQYTCKKATYDKIVETKNFSSEMEKMTDATDTIKVVAWFTESIPVSNGPAKSWGLPGLILELKSGDIQFLCSQIILNPEDGIDIKIPKKGKEVTEKEFDEAMEKDMEKMMKKYNGNGEKEIHIKIGG